MGPQSIYQIDPLSDARWDGLIHRHPHASVFHTPSWLRALQIAYGYQPVVLTTTPEGEPLGDGIAFCDVHSWITGRRLVSVPFSDHCEPLLPGPGDDCEGFAAMWNRLSRKKIDYLEFRPIVVQPPAATILSRDKNYLLHRLDLRPDLDTLYRGFHKSCVQRVIRRAEKEKLEVVEGHSPELLRDFYRLLTITRKKHGLPPQPLRWFQALIRTFGPDVKIRVAYREKDAVAAILTLAFRNTLVYKYGGSDPAFNNLGGTSLLFWKTIQEAKTNGLAIFDMGRTDTDNEGLIAFKEHWGAVATPLQYWRIPGHHHQQASPSRLKALVKRSAAACSPSVLQAVGSLVYKHIG